MDPLSNRSFERAVGANGELFANPMKKDERESSLHIWSDWSLWKEFKEMATSDFSNHVISLALYSIPLFGSCIKLVDLIVWGNDFATRWSLEDLSLENMTERVKEELTGVKRRVAELQVNDCLYLLSFGVQYVAYKILGFTHAPVLLLGVLPAVALTTGFCMLLRVSEASEGLAGICAKQQKLDLHVLRHALERTRRTIREELKQDARELYIQLHKVFRYKIADVRDEANKILRDRKTENIFQAITTDNESAAIFQYVRARLEIISNL